MASYTNHQLFVYAWSHSYRKNYNNIVRAYGIDTNGRTTVLNMSGYSYTAYIEIPDSCESMIDLVLSHLFKPDSNTMAKIKADKPICAKAVNFTPDRVSVHKLMKLYYYNTRPCTFVHCVFKNYWKLKQLIARVAVHCKYNVRIHECDDFNITPIIKMFALRHLKPVGWINAIAQPSNECSYFEQNIECHYNNVCSVDIAKYPKFTILALDIECISRDSTINASIMPNPHKAEDVIFNIGISIKCGDSITKILLYYASVDINPDASLSDNEGYGIHTIRYTSEKDMIIGLRDIVRQYNPQIILGYNVIRFDLDYILKRAYDKHCRDDFLKLGALVDPCEARYDAEEKRMRGKLILQSIDIDGRILLDMLDVVKSSGVKLDQYTLSSVCTHFKIPNKDPMTVHEIFQSYHTQNIDALRTVGKYCVQDAYVSLVLFDKMMVLYELLENSKTCQVPPNVYYNRGHQVRFVSQLYAFCKDNGYVMDCDNYSSSISEYMGAYNLTPKVGLHHNVLAFDFCSLYPSIMIAYNICFTTLLRESDMQHLSPDDYNEFTWDEHVNCEHTSDPNYIKKQGKRKIIICSTIKTRFVKAHVRKGIVPQLVETFLRKRKEVRKAMESVTDQEMLAIMDKRQLSNKIAANAMYGLLGIPKIRNGYVPLMEGASTITYIGRRTIKKVIVDIERTFNASAVYGDSVTGDTALLIRQKGKIRTVRIDELPGTWQTYNGVKECIVPDVPTEVWSERGFTHIRKIIRHRTDKPIKRIVTHTGIVDATIDHSLLLSNGSEISPSHVKVGDELLHISNSAMVDMLVANATSNSITNEEAFSMGMFMAEGSCGIYKCASGIKYSWTINNSDIELLQRCQSGLPFQTKILDTIESSRVYKLVPVHNTKDRVMEYRSLFYNESREKKVPSVILCSSNEIIQSFMDGFYAGGKQYRFDQKGKEAGLGLWLLCIRLRWKSISINSRTDKPNVFRYTCSDRSMLRYSPNEIKKILDMPTDTNRYVYDLETESHHFHVGPGCMVVHNTDSCMVMLNDVQHAKPSTKLLVDLSRRANDITSFINEQMVKPMCLAYEGKVYHTMLVFAKKRYFNVLMSESKETECPLKFDVNCKGLAIKRRGYCQYMKTLYKYVIEAGIHGVSCDEVCDKLQYAIYLMFTRQIKNSQFVVTSNIKDSYKAKNIAQVKLCNKHEVRTGARIIPNTRISFVFVHAESDKHADKAELYDHFIANRHIYRIDYLEYLSSQFIEPFDQLLYILFGEKAVCRAQPYRRKTKVPLKPERFMARQLRYRECFKNVMDELVKPHLVFYSSPSHKCLYEELVRRYPDTQSCVHFTWIKKLQINDYVHYRENGKWISQVYRIINITRNSINTLFRLAKDSDETDIVPALVPSTDIKRYERDFVDIYIPSLRLVVQFGSEDTLTILSEDMRKHKTSIIFVQNTNNIDSVYQLVKYYNPPQKITL